jgi:uridine kinase
MHAQQLATAITNTLRHKANTRSTTILAIDGGTALGKSTIARAIAKQLHHYDIGTNVIGTDSYQMPRHQRTALGLEAADPNAMRINDLASDLQTLNDGGTILLGEYNHYTGTTNTPVTMNYQPVMIIEGIHSLSTTISNATRIDLRLFLDADEHIMKAARLQRDQAVGIADEQWHERWPAKYTAYQAHVLPERRYASTIITREHDENYTIED